MSRNNDVFSVLVAETVLTTAGKSVSELAPKQIGVFNADTNLSLASNSTAPKGFYLAVGVADKSNPAILGDIVTSAGQLIQKENVKFYQAQKYSAGLPEIVEITNFTAKSDSEYAIKFEFRNQKIYNLQGYNQFSKTYVVKTSCGETSVGDPVELVTKFLEALNNDGTGMFKAEAIAGGTLLTVTTAPTVAGDITVSIGDVDIAVTVAATDTAAEAATKIAAAINAATTTDAKAVASGATVQISNIVIGTEATVDEGTTLAVVTATEGNAVVDLATIAEGVTPGIRVTTNPLAVNEFCNINTLYFKPRETVMIVSLTSGFDCGGIVEVIQDVAYEQGSGYDVRQREYKAGGWNGKPGPYRVSELNGVASSGFRYFSETTKKYHRVNLTYDLFSIGGWQEFLNNVATEIYFEEADVAGLTDFLGVLEAVLPTGFESQISKF